MHGGSRRDAEIAEGMLYDRHAEYAAHHACDRTGASRRDWRALCELKMHPTGRTRRVRCR